MVNSIQLAWLPEPTDWRQSLKALGGNGDTLWADAVALSMNRLDFIQTNALDGRLATLLRSAPEGAARGEPVRLAVLGSSTLAHLLAGIRVAGLRRNLHIDVYESDYGQYYQELMNPQSGLYAFKPHVILFAFDARHLTAGLDSEADEAERDAVLESSLAHLVACWSQAKAAFGCQVIQQNALGCIPALLGANEHRYPASRAAFIARLNERIPAYADKEGVDILSVDGLAVWHDVALWNRTKQELPPTASPIYGDLVARVIAARRGKSAKALVLDLDNTLWGGVIGDDGLSGIVLGQGSGDGESYSSIQAYAKALAGRGVILAVCSKNDEMNAQEPFSSHPEMLLKLEDIACFKANWDDKATNLRAIAAELNIGLDALVFLDDNPFERNFVRQQLPMVAVPEFPEDPAHVPGLLAAAGYFEAATVTGDDRRRVGQYRENANREALRRSSSDLESYLSGLSMQLQWQPVNEVGFARAVQLINKTNQFNLTTRRMNEEEMQALIKRPDSFVLEFRLIDRFGDNGIIAIVVGERDSQPGTVRLTNWLMSCRVLGRQVERSMLNVVADVARRFGYSRLLGEYRQSAKNAMVKDHYRSLGFEPIGEPPDGTDEYILPLENFCPLKCPIVICETQA
jgi:FkbH-like protein